MPALPSTFFHQIEIPAAFPKSQLQTIGHSILLLSIAIALCHSMPILWIAGALQTAGWNLPGSVQSFDLSEPWTHRIPWVKPTLFGAKS